MNETLEIIEKDSTNNQVKPFYIKCLLFVSIISFTLILINTISLLLYFRYFSPIQDPDYECFHLNKRGTCYKNCLLKLDSNRSTCFMGCDFFASSNISCGSKVLSLVPINLHSAYGKSVIAITVSDPSSKFEHFLYKITQVFPDWVVRFYISRNLKSETVKNMIKSNSEVILALPQENYINLIPNAWSFFVADDPHVLRYIIRPVDHIFSKYELIGLQNWFTNKTMYHFFMYPYFKDPLKILQHLPASTRTSDNWGGIVSESSIRMKTIFDEDYESKTFERQEFEYQQMFWDRYIFPSIKFNATCYTKDSITTYHDLQCIPISSIENSI